MRVYYLLMLSTLLHGLELIDVDGIRYAESLAEVNETVTRYEAIIRIANWFWKHSDSTLYSNSGDPIINVAHDMRSDIKAGDEEYERFVNASLYYIFDGNLSEKGYNTCSNRHWNPEFWFAYPKFTVDYYPMLGDLAEIIKLAQPLTERHWPWKTRLHISQTKDGRDYAHVCMGIGCTKKYLFFIHSCTVPEYSLSSFFSSLQNTLIHVLM